MTPLLILPGLLEDADAFAHQIAALSVARTCKVADLTRADSIAALARAALAQAPAGRFALAGHSMGGYVALEVVRQAPERVERLALLNTNARADSPESTANRERLMALAGKDFPGVIASLTPKLLSAKHQQDTELVGVLSEMALATGKDAFLRQERAIIGRIDSRPHLGTIACPALVLAAREDAIMPVALHEEMAAAIRGARLAVVEDSGHMASLEQPAEVTRLMKEWLAA